MKIKPVNWEIIGDYCCNSFKVRVEQDSYEGAFKIPDFSTDGKKVHFKNETIEFCPFCGKKIFIERVMQ